MVSGNPVNDASARLPASDPRRSLPVSAYPLVYASIIAIMT